MCCGRRPQVCSVRAAVLERAGVNLVLSFCSPAVWECSIMLCCVMGTALGVYQQHNSHCTSARQLPCSVAGPSRWPAAAMLWNPCHQPLLPACLSPACRLLREGDERRAPL